MNYEEFQNSDKNLKNILSFFREKNKEINESLGTNIDLFASMEEDDYKDIENTTFYNPYPVFKEGKKLLSYGMVNDGADLPDDYQDCDAEDVSVFQDHITIALQAKGELLYCNDVINDTISEHHKIYYTDTEENIINFLKKYILIYKKYYLDKK